MGNLELGLKSWRRFVGDFHQVGRIECVRAVLDITKMSLICHCKCGWRNLKCSRGIFSLSLISRQACEFELLFFFCDFQQLNLNFSIDRIRWNELQWNAKLYRHRQLFSEHFSILADHLSGGFRWARVESTRWDLPGFHFRKEWVCPVCCVCFRDQVDIFTVSRMTK